MLPPVAVQLRLRSTVSPVELKATAISWLVPAVGSVTDLGMICRRIVGSVLVMGETRGLSQAAVARATTTNASFSKANRTDSLCLNVMTLGSSAVVVLARQGAPGDSWSALQRRGGCTGRREQR